MKNERYWISCIFRRNGVTCTYCRVHTCMDCFLYKYQQDFKNTNTEMDIPRIRVWKILFLALEEDD